MVTKPKLPKIYEDNWVKAEANPDLFVSTYISPNPGEPLKPTDEQSRFMKKMTSGLYDEGWFAGGNSSGKTWTAKFMAVHWATYKIRPNRPFNNYDEFAKAPYNILCTGPENKQAMELWAQVEAAFKESPILKFNISQVTTGTRRNIHPNMVLNNGTQIEAVGMHDKARHIEGQAYDLILINEPADARYLIHCYERVLIPRTWRRGGIICGFGTPKGKGAYYSLWRRGQKTLEDLPNKFFEPRIYAQYSDSRTNPYANQESIIKAMEGKDDSWIRERVEGRFTDSTYSAFLDSDVDAVIDMNMKPVTAPLNGHQYIHGVDFGRKGDYTGIITWDLSTKPYSQVNMYRNGGGLVSWENIFEDLIRIYNQYGGEFVTDATGMGGDMQSEWLSDLGVPYIPFQFGGSPAKKVALINNLQDFFTKKMFKMPFHEKLVEELRNYPANLDDKTIETDMVMALALTAWGARNYEPLAPVESYHR